MIYLILISAFSGAVVTLMLQFLLIYRRSPEPILRTEQYAKVVPDNALKDYFNSQHVEPGQLQQQDGTASAGYKPQEAASARQQEASVTGGSPKQQASPPAHSDSVDADKPETCHFLNAIFLFLFRELRDTPLVRHWLTKKIKVEFEELLQTKTAGRLLEGLSLRDISLGNSLPVFKTAKLMKPVNLNEDGMPEELNFEVDIEYNGGFHLAIDVELVFWKSAYLFVKMRRVVGKLRLQFTRVPFTHWSFSFLEDPLVDFEVKSQFEGRPLPQLTSIIVNQLKRVIKKKHTLPNYKIRYKPFFPFQVQSPQGSTSDLELSVQDSRLVEGRLKVTLIECSRLFILGSYERETYVHCTLELNSHQWKEKTRSSIKRTEVIKGPCGSVGMTFRHVPASEGEAVHVSIETVTPNSPAALADLQRGDRLIAIGGVKVTSSVQVPKLLKQAGDRVVVLYERPVRHQTPSLGSLGTLQEGFGQLEESGFISQPGGYEEDPAPITTLSDITDSKDMDSEFEELIVDSKPSPNVGPLSTSDTKDDFLLTVNQSPKKTVANLASKPLGTISPILNRKLNLVGLQSPLKAQPKESPKPSRQKTSNNSGDSLQRPAMPPPPPPSRPPVPPRPQIRLSSAGSESIFLESVDSTTSTTPLISTATATVSASEKSPEKAPLTGAIEDLAGTEKIGVKPSEAKSTRPSEPSDDIGITSFTSSKADQAKDKVSESSCSTRDSLEEHPFWESPESMFRHRTTCWPKASVVFEVDSNHKYLNVALWCKDPFKLGSLLCLGHVSLHLEHVALECMATSSAEYQSTFKLGPPEPRANVSRTALRSLSTHKGFNEKLCYGDVTLNFCYLAGDELDYPGMAEREREGSLHDDDLRERVREQFPTASRDDLAYGAMQLVEVRHNFQDTQFQNPTWCEYCKKKVWTKAASQCMICAYVCHKKCQEKCLAESPLCVAPTERRGADPEAKSTINRATSGLTRHIINTSSRLLNLRQAPKTRLVEQVTDAVPGAVDPSPKHTPNTSDNESSDTETYTSGASPSKQPVGGGGGSGKLVRNEGGLDDSVFIAVKEIGRDLYRGLPTDERSQKLELMLDKLQQEIDQELEHNNALLMEERETSDPRRKVLISSALSKSGERLQALTLLMIHYRAGIEDLESVESTSPSEQQCFKGRGDGLEEEALMGAEVYDSDICNPADLQLLDDITEEQICVEALH
ncbi:PDZ domain-containing protein 8 [Hippocampus zosterae]|uniref:PDZ domain-containing protein 8 n=1 Tax=Hippocampus zosterae TaxID=109293 RepID=UPI00223D5B8E|nr:PDZ domain-containing protein 8 [Hippocampus zosterae]XP_051936981.1 PDZ domain-containing protein 8 [Hippocampus zosterae]